MNEIAAYGGFPTRYPHWRWGMEYERLSKSHEYGLSKIYELVINNNPSIAYLLEGNGLVDQKLVMAHVYAHVDFFKNNFCFKANDEPRTGPKNIGADVRKWIDKMANHGSALHPDRGPSALGIQAVEAAGRLPASEPREPGRPLQSPFVSFDMSPSKRPMDDESSRNIGSPKVGVSTKTTWRTSSTPRSTSRSRRRTSGQTNDRKRRVNASRRSLMQRRACCFLLESAPLERWERVVRRGRAGRRPTTSFRRCRPRS